MKKKFYKKEQNVKKHSTVKNFKRIEKFSYKKQKFLIYVDKNDSVYEILQVYNEEEIYRNVYFFNRVKGNPYRIAINKIKAEIEYGYGV